MSVASYSMENVSCKICITFISDCEISAAVTAMLLSLTLYSLLITAITRHRFFFKHTNAPSNYGPVRKVI